MALPAHSPGYAGAYMFNADWAKIQRGLGAKYWVDDLAALKVTPKTGGTREVNIAAGIGGGHGILDTNDATATVQLPTVASGTSYFMIVLKRTWGVTQASTFGYIAAGTSSATLPTRATDPGNTADDQPLALVSLASGSTNPVVVADLRAIGHGKDELLAFDERVLQYINWPGARVTIGEKQWFRRINIAGNAFEWATTDNTVVLATGTAWTGAVKAGWAISTCVGRKVRIGPGFWLVDAFMEFQRTGACIQPNKTTGGMTDADTNAVQLLVGWRPTSDRRIAMAYLGKDNDTTDIAATLVGRQDGAGFGYISRAGTVAMGISGTPRININRNVLATDHRSLSCTDTYFTAE